MIEVYPGLHIGDERDYELQVKQQDGWRIVHACKEPYHRRELRYSTRGAPKNHAEYFVARRDNRLILNFVDAPDPAYIPKQIVDTALDFIGESLGSGYKVLVHCNLGESRSPAIGLLYLAAFTGAIPSSSLEEAEAAFLKIYPGYRPGPGIRGFLEQNWSAYCASGQQAK
jgi:predicted protein tyrosine phosphatase